MGKLLQAFRCNHRVEENTLELHTEPLVSQETGESAGPSGEGARSSGRRSYADRILFSRPAHYEPTPPMKRLAHGALSVLLSTILAIQPITAEIARAQVISNPTAPIQFRPNVTSSGNGTPLVNIVTPSFGGVSHNKFQSYDIDTRGLILNNSAIGGQSVIGGSVSGNPNLVGSPPARIIVNEVTSSRASTLNGPTEVFGSTADVVVANPNGISCVSCSFINAGRTTLTTGVPTPDYNTGAMSYKVERGTISISGTGLNGAIAPLGNIDLIGRQVEINGPVSGTGQVRIRVGAINYDQSTDVTTAIAGAPAVSGLAVSSSAFGTITAGSVSVLSKDVNLGVNLAGDITTLDGHLLIQGAGDVTLNNTAITGDIAVQAQGVASFTGAAQATGRISANGNDVAVDANAALASGDAIVLQAINAITSAGFLKSDGDTSLTAGGAVSATGVIQAHGQAVVEGDTVTANAFTVYGTEVTIIGRSSVTLNETALSADGAIRVMAPDIALGQNTGFKTDGLISLDAKHNFFTDSVLDYPNLVLSVRDNMTIGSHGGLVQDDINYTLTGTIDNAGQIYGRNATVLTAANLINQDTGEIYGREITITVTDRLTNLGLIMADDTLNAIAASLNNGADGLIYAADTTVTVTNALNNLGSILSDNTLKVLANGANVVNDGTLKANGTATVEAGSYTANSANAVLAGAKVAVTVTGNLANNGRILSADTLTVNAGSLENQTDAMIYGTGVTVSLAGAMTNAGKILSAADLTIDTGSSLITNSGALQANDGLSIAAGGYTGTATAIVGGDIVIITASGAIDNAGRIVGDDLLLMRADSLNNRAKGKIQSFDIGLALTGDMTNAGAIQAIDLLNLTANNLNNKGTIVATEISRPDPSNAASPASGISLTGKLTNSGTILAVNNLILSAKALQNNGGATLQGGNAVSALIDKDLTNNGTILSDNILILAANNLTNSGDASNIATISGAYLQATIGKNLTNGPYAVLQGTETTNIRAQTATLDYVHANGVEQGIFNYGHDLFLVLSKQGLDIGAGQSMIVDGELTLVLGGDVNIMGTLASRSYLALQTSGSIFIGSSDPSNPGGGEIFTRGSAEIVAARNITNTASVIQALGSLLYIEAGGTVTNTRTAQRTWLSGAIGPSFIMGPGFLNLKDPKKFTDYLYTHEETSAPAEIWADGDIFIKAGTVNNDASTIYAGGQLVIQAAIANNLSRDTGVYAYAIKNKSTNAGKIFWEGWFPTIPHLETTAAMIGDAGFNTGSIGKFVSTGITRGAVVRIDAETLVNGITDPNRFTAPAHIPNPVIDLTHYFTGGSAGAVSGPGARGPVTIGNITYLHGAPISGGANERGPGWILEQVGDTRGNLTFFADPTIEQRLINQALIEETGRSLLDPKYRDGVEQQQGLWQGTVDYLEAHPDVKLGDNLSDAQRKDVNDPIIWYHTATIDGQNVLVPELILPESRLAEWTKQNGGVIAGDSIYLSGDFIHNTGFILAGQDLTIEAGTFINERRVTTIGETNPGGEGEHLTNSGNYWGDWRQDILQDGGVISGASVSIFTQGDLYNIGGSIIAGHDLTLFAGGDLVIAPQTINTHWEDGSKANGGKVDDTIHSGGTILSGGSATLIAGGDVNVIGSTVKANDDLTLVSLTGDVNIVATVNVTDHTVNDDGVKDRHINVTNEGSDIVAGGDLSILAGAGDITLQASHLGGDSITLSAADIIHFATGTDERIFTETGKSSDGVTQTTYNNGHTSQNLVYDTMDIGEGGLKIIAAQVIVDYLASITQTTTDKKGNEVVEGIITQSPMDAIAKILDNPGMGWLAQVTSDGSLNVTFNGQDITNSSWDHDQTTLTPAAAAIIAIVVSVITMGAGSPIMAAIQGAVNVIAGATATTAVTAAIATGVASFVSSTISGTIIGAINGNLDMGQVLMNALASGVTAGLTYGLNDIINSVFGPSLDKILPQIAQNPSLLPAAAVSSLVKIGVDSVISAGIRAALLGEDFGDGFISALTRNAVNMFIEPVGFKLVGDMDLGAGTIGNALVHAVIGAAGGYIVNGVDGLAGGALGAFLGELVLSDDFNRNDPIAVQNMQGLQQIIGALASFAVGDDSMSGADAAVNGFLYNFLGHKNMEELDKAAGSCADSKGADTAACNKYTALLKLSEANEVALAECSGVQSTACNGLRAIAEAARKESGLSPEEWLAERTPAKIKEAQAALDDLNKMFPNVQMAKNEAAGSGSNATRPPSSGPHSDKSLDEIKATITGAPKIGETTGSTYLDQFIKNGPVGLTSECASLVQFFAPTVGLTKTWVQGDAVLGNPAMTSGTPIATFDGPGDTYNGGAYKHTAIYLAQNSDGIIVLDQWNSQGYANVRLIRTNGQNQNGASNYYVIK